MSVSRCPACGASMRSRTLVTLLDARPGAEVTRNRVGVCRSCLARALIVVAPMVATSPRETLSPDEVNVRRVLRALGKKLRGLAPAYAGNPAAHVWDTAADIAEAWASSPAARV